MVANVLFQFHKGTIKPELLLFKVVLKVISIP